MLSSFGVVSRLFALSVFSKSTSINNIHMHTVTHIVYRKNTSFLLTLALFFTVLFTSQASAVEPKLLWTYEIGGAVRQAPLERNNIVIVASTDKKMVALDAKTGEFIWEYKPAGGMWHRAFTANDDSVFIALPGGAMASLDLKTGKEQWRAQLGINTLSRPLISGDSLFVPTTFVGSNLKNGWLKKAKMFVLDLKTGRIKWSFDTDNYVLQTPFVNRDGMIYLAGSYYDKEIHDKVEEGGPMRLYAISPKTHKAIWEFTSIDGFVKAIYATHEVVTFVGYQDFVSGVNGSNGDLLWRNDTGNWVPSLSGHGNVMYYGSANTNVFAVNVISGRNLWKYNVPKGVFNYMLGSGVREGKRLHFLTQRGNLIALNSDTGKEIWNMKTGLEAQTGLSVGSSKLLMGDAHGKVYAYSLPK